jgi:hypothetical protein
MLFLDKRSKFVAWSHDVGVRTRSNRLPKYFAPTSLAPSCCARWASTNSLVSSSGGPSATKDYKTAHAIGQAGVEGSLFSIFLIGPPGSGAVAGLSRASSMGLKPVKTLRDATSEQRPFDVAGTFTPWK